MTRENKLRTILSFVLGAAAGAVTALLVAPKSGAQLRDEISEGVDDAVNQVGRSAKDLKHRAQKLVNSAKARVEYAVDDGQVGYDQAKNS